MFIILVLLFCLDNLPFFPLMGIVFPTCGNNFSLVREYFLPNEEVSKPSFPLLGTFRLLTSRSFLAYFTPARLLDGAISESLFQASFLNTLLAQLLAGHQELYERIILV
jgi:hypothetical protein